MEDSASRDNGQHCHHTQDSVSSDVRLSETTVPITSSACAHCVHVSEPDTVSSEVPQGESCQAAAIAPTSPPHPMHLHPEPPTRRPSLRNQELLALKNAYSSINSDISCSSVSSVESLLELRRENPEEILLALGFGGCFEEAGDPLLRIPYRFFEQQSTARGINVGEIIQRRHYPYHFQRSSIEKAEREGHQPDDSQDEPLKGAKHPKLQLMNSTSSKFSGGPAEQHSPLGSPFAPLSPRHSVASPNASHHSSEFFLSVPVTPHPYRKLSCPNIHSELSYGAQSDTKLELPHLRSGRWPVRPASATDLRRSSLDQLTHQQLASILTRNESLDRLKPSLTSMLAEIGSNSNLNLGYFIETALLTTIESLKLSLDFYRYFMLVRTDSVDCETCSHFSERSTSDYGSKARLREGIDDSTVSLQRAQARSQLMMERNKQRLSLQNIYLDILEVETMLYDCLAKFKNSSNWPVFVAKYIQQLQKAVDKISAIQESLRSLNANYSRSLVDFIAKS